MPTGRLLLLFFISWAAFWGAPASAAERAVDRVMPAERPHEMRPAFEMPSGHLVELAEAASEPLPEDSGRASAKIACSTPRTGSRISAARLRIAPFLSSDLLLLIQRQNE